MESGERRPWGSEDPHVEEQEEDGEEEPKPHFPADAGALSHAKHAVHVPAEPDSSTLEGAFEAFQICGISDLIADSKRDLAIHC